MKIINIVYFILCVFTLALAHHANTEKSYRLFNYIFGLIVTLYTVNFCEMGVNLWL